MYKLLYIMEQVDRGNVLKNIRDFLGMSQDEFAKMLGSTATTVSRRERSDWAVAKLTLLEVVRLQNALALQGKQIQDFLDSETKSA